MPRLLLICLGGALGTGARYLLSDLLRRRLGGAFPYGTFAVNLLGCFLISVILRLGPLVPETTRLALVIGFLGGFTTYSSFNNETLQYALSGRSLMALGYFASTAALGLLAGLLGFAGAERLLQRYSS